MLNHKLCFFLTVHCFVVIVTVGEQPTIEPV